ncbi:MAG TPA: tetratricopeptide repeat protein [Bryobacteraceae bacterium]|nr:tetratricopeptide repeat protein [Bryobacteraceae bacterium]
MIAFLFLLFLPPVSNAPDPAVRLRQCIDKRDRSCLVSELTSRPRSVSPEYWSAAAEAYLLLGRNTDAVTAMANAVRTRPGDFEMLIQQGRVYQRCGDQVHAIEAFLLAAKINPSPGVFYSMGLSFFLAHEYERAGKHFVHAVQLDNRNHKAAFMLAVIDVLKNHDNESAKSHLERALAVEPGNPHYLLHYGIVLSELDNPQAAEVLERAVKTDPANPLARFNLGRLYRRMGEIRKARTELETAVRMRPQLARAQYQLAAVYRELGDMDKAQQATEQFLKFRDQDRDDNPVDGPPSYAFPDQPAK